MLRWKFGKNMACSEHCVSSFTNVVTLSCCKFHLLDFSIGLLQATIGGYAADFHVLLLNDQVFKFSVSSKLVGFFMNKLNSFNLRSTTPFTFGALLALMGSRSLNSILRNNMFLGSKLL